MNPGKHAARCQNRHWWVEDSHSQPRQISSFKQGWERVIQMTGGIWRQRLFVRIYDLNIVTVKGIIEIRVIDAGLEEVWIIIGDIVDIEHHDHEIGVKVAAFYLILKGLLQSAPAHAGHCT